MRRILSKLAYVAKWALDIEHFHYMRGQIIAVWSTIESHMDLANNEAWHYSRGTISTVVPQTLRWKLALFKQIHRDLLPFRELSAEAAHLLAEVKRYQDDRHWLVHGNLWPSGSKPGVYALTRGTYTKHKGLTIKKREITVHELKELRANLLALSAKFALYSLAVGAKMVKHGADDQRG